MTKRQRRAIWKKAAERIECGEEQFACLAIANSFKNYDMYREKLNLFYCYFQPNSDRGYWWLSKRTVKNQLARQIALLLMGEMEE